VETCMDASDIRGLSGLDILVLHATNHRARNRRMSEICMVLNIDETHLVAYALKKLIAAGLVRVRAQGREHLYETTPAGDAACAAYRRTREEFLVSGIALTHGPDQLAQIERVMRTLLGQYDQAGRFATAASIARPRRPPPVKTKR
jgi:predicted MarR family transcription regulator